MTNEEYLLLINGLKDLIDQTEEIKKMSYPNNISEQEKYDNLCETINSAEKLKLKLSNEWKIALSKE